MTKPMIHCAIYTRKSSDEGLDQGFNSLDAQHEACAAYIASQRHEGWKMLSSRYDDGGLSDGTLERPALQRLLLDRARDHGLLAQGTLEHGSLSLQAFSGTRGVPLNRPFSSRTTRAMATAGS